MSDMQNEPAFPSPTFNGQSQGLTKREWFAGLTMQALLTDSERCYGSWSVRAEDAVKAADALILALDKKGDT